MCNSRVFGAGGQETIVVSGRHLGRFPELMGPTAMAGDPDTQAAASRPQGLNSVLVGRLTAAFGRASLRSPVPTSETDPAQRRLLMMMHP